MNIHKVSHTGIDSSAWKIENKKIIIQAERCSSGFGIEGSSESRKYFGE